MVNVEYDMKLYAVIDTNVLVSSLLSVRENSPVVLVWDSILNSDPDDRVFFEVMLSRSDAYLITGNKKHFPQFERVISPAEAVYIIQLQESDNKFFNEP